MKKSVASWQLAGFAFTSVVGTLLHFLFDWTGQNAVVGLFSAVNESIWEHIKLIFYPMLVFALIEHRAWGKECSNFWCVKLMGILLAVILIPVLYYSYTGILGVSADWFNIAIFFITAAISYWLETRLFKGKIACFLPTWAVWVVLGGLVVLFTVLTFASPHIPLFQDPVTGEWGIGEFDRVGRF